MKRQLITMLAAAASFATVANAEIVLTEDLSVYGYLDMSAANIDLPGDSSSTAVAEFELAFDYTTDPFFSVVELSFTGNDDGNLDTALETAIVGYNVDENLSISAGNILSYLGWESYDATGLYQFSYAYSKPNLVGIAEALKADGDILNELNSAFGTTFTSLDDVPWGITIPGYAVGASIDYVTDDYSLGFWIGDSDNYDISYEVMLKYTGIDGLTLFAAYADDPAYETLDFWASYEVEGWTFAAEYVDTDYEISDLDSSAYLFMVNYAIDNWGITARYSVEDIEFADEDWKLFTISPSYTFSDNLMGLLEVSFIEEAYGLEDIEGAPDYWLAAELIYTF